MERNGAPGYTVAFESGITVPGVLGHCYSEVA